MVTNDDVTKHLSFPRKPPKRLGVRSAVTDDHSSARSSMVEGLELGRNEWCCHSGRIPASATKLKRSLSTRPTSLGLRLTALGLSLKGFWD